MKPQTILQTLVLALGLQACHVVEPGDVSGFNAAACGALVGNPSVQPGQPRFLRYRTHVDMGEALPNSVSTRGGGRAIRDYVGRSIHTKAVPTDFDPRVVVMVLQYIFLVIAGFMGIITGSIWTSSSDTKLKRRNLAVTLGALCSAIACGYFSGSAYSLDNTTQYPLEVSLDGHVYTIPPQSFMNVRAAGFSIDIQTRYQGNLVEQLSAKPDKDIVYGALRVLFGGPRYIYSVCGLNNYEMGTAHYGR